VSGFLLDDGDVVVVIGSGAGGGTAAHELTRRGIPVVLLESGPALGPADYVNDEWAGYDMLSWLDPRQASGSWRVARDHPRAPVWHCEVVGGTTAHWSGCAYRLQAHELRARSTYGELPGTSLIDWPFTLEDLLPWYERAEHKMQVAGTQGRPPLPPNNNYKVMYWGARRAGLQRISTGRHAINAVPQDGRPASLQDGFTITGDKHGARWSTAQVEIPRAQATGRLDLRPGCRALRIEHDGDGRVDAVVYVERGTGRVLRQRARVVVLAANCVESSRLLLHSDSARFPQGLANGWGQVGRHYLRHVVQTLWSLFEQPVHMHRGEIMAGLVEDFAGNDPARGFHGGYYIELNSMGLPSTAMLLEPGWWGRDFAAVMERYAYLAGLYMTGEDMPRADNRITLHDGECDQYGVPLACVHYDDHPNDLAMRRHGYDRMADIHRAAGALRCIETPPYPATHNLGSNRMSRRPEDGVLDGWGRAHELPNLFIADGSAFSTGGAANPTLTIVALAMRQADEIARRLHAREL